MRFSNSALGCGLSSAGGAAAGFSPAVSSLAGAFAGARQRVELRAGRALRKAHGGQGDMALQHPRKAVAHLGCRRAYGDGAGHIRGAVEILRPGIDEVQFAVAQDAVAPGSHRVMDDGAVRAGAGYRAK